MIKTFTLTPEQKTMVDKTLALNLSTAEIENETAQIRKKVIDKMLENEDSREHAMHNYNAKRARSWRESRFRQALAAAEQILEASDIGVVRIDRADLWQLVESIKLATRPL